MKIQLFSDLHIEFEDLDVNCSQADVVIFAGDIDVGTKGVAWIKRQKITCPVIYVPGNHEFYRHSHPRLIQKLRDASLDSNIHVLENTSVSIDGVAFHGATLWTDFELFGDPKYAGQKCQEMMNDFTLIRRDPSYSRLRTLDASIIHENTLAWLGQSLEKSQNNKNIVITHHAPSKRSLPEKDADHIVSAAYASNLESFIEKYKPDYWLHGHVHTSLNYLIGNCHVLCNARGYTKGRCNDDFNPYLLIEI